MEIKFNIHNGPVDLTINVNTILLCHSKTLRSAGPIEYATIELYEEDIDAMTEALQTMKQALKRRRER